MTYSQATLIKRIRAILNDNPYNDTCTEAMDTTETGLDVTDGTEYQEGNLIEFQDDGELCLVRSVSSNTLTVVRNYQFSVTATAGTGTSHSISTEILKDPLYRYSQIVLAVADVLLNLWPYVYRKYPLSLTPSTISDWYNADTTIKDISSVVQRLSTTNRMFFYGERRSTYPAELHFDVNTDIVASGVGIWIPYLRDTTNTITVNGIARITDVVSGGNYTHLNDGVEVTCVIYYAVADLIARTDIIRTTQDDVSMGDATVRPLTRTQLSDYWMRKGLAARRQWERDLLLTYPHKHYKQSVRPRTEY